MTSPTIPNSAEALRARLEQGVLPRDRLTLGDYLGHEPSRAALRREGPPTLEPDAAASLEFWARRLGQWGPAVMLRAGFALACGVRDHLDPNLPEPTREALDQGSDVVRQFLAEPKSTERGQVEDAAQHVARAALEHPADHAARRACQALLPTLRTILDLLGERPPERPELNAHYLRAVEQAAQAEAPPETLRARVHDDLLPWALGD